MRQAIRELDTVLGLYRDVLTTNEQVPEENIPLTLTQSIKNPLLLLSGTLSPFALEPIQGTAR